MCVGERVYKAEAKLSLHLLITITSSPPSCALPLSSTLLLRFFFSFSFSIPIDAIAYIHYDLFLSFSLSCSFTPHISASLTTCNFTRMQHPFNLLLNVHAFVSLKVRRVAISPICILFLLHIRARDILERRAFFFGPHMLLSHFVTTAWMLFVDCVLRA